MKPQFKPGSPIAITKKTTPAPAVTEEEIQHDKRVIQNHADKKAIDEKPSRGRGRPKKEDAYNAELPKIICSDHLVNMLEALALDDDRSLSYVMRSLLLKGAEAAIIHKGLEHKIKK